MKKVLFMTVLLCLAVINAVAATFTDENGVTWTYKQNTYTINGESKKLWTITDASGYGEDLVFPETLGTYPTEAIASQLFNNNSRVINMTLPSSLVYIAPDNSNSYNGTLMFYGGTIRISATTPPILAKNRKGVFNYFGSATIIVPKVLLDTYRQAEGWSEYDVKILAEDTKTDYAVTTSAQSNSSGLVSAIGEANLMNVMSLKITGTINSYDILVIRTKMHNLQHLDMTDATIVGNTYPYLETYYTTDNKIGVKAFCDLHKLASVKLPKNITDIGNKAFYGCYGLRNVEFQSHINQIGSDAFNSCRRLKEATVTADHFGSYAFSGCYSMTTLTIPECVAIGNYAFSDCTGLKTVTIGKCINIWAYAFRGCSNLTNVSLPNGLKLIDHDAFYSCKALPTITLPEGLETIGGSAFYGCTALVSVSFPSTLISIASHGFRYCSSLLKLDLPARLTTIGDYCFNGCTALQELHIPGSMDKIGTEAFSACPNLKSVYSYTLEPTTINEFTFSTNEDRFVADLYIPYYSYWTYWYDTQWAKFASVNRLGKDYFILKPMSEDESIYVNNDFIFNDESGVLPATVDADLHPGSGLIVDITNETLSLDEVRMAQDQSVSASILANNNLNVNTLYFDITVAKNKWYFLTFPFRVKLSNVTAPSEQFVFRLYDGQVRATNGKGGWQAVTSTTLEPEQGYIFQTDTDGTLTLKVEKDDIDFVNTNRQDALVAYVAADAQNASWNFVGNPQPCYFDLSKTGYTAPITVWNGSSYIAVRPGDDTYYVKPFEAFFVQKPEDVAKIQFPADGRMTCKQVEEAKKLAAARSSVSGNESYRYLLNLMISDGQSEDKTRLVYNETKSSCYEIDCDAAKFLSTERVPQIYSLDQQMATRYAINERPQGEVRLGYVAPVDGTLTISVQRMDIPMVLRDLQEGIDHPLSTGAYTFQTQAGTFEQRFLLVAAPTAITAPRSVNGSSSAVAPAYTLSGQPAKPGQKGLRIVKGKKEMK